MPRAKFKESVFERSTIASPERFLICLHGIEGNFSHRFPMSISHEVRKRKQAKAKTCFDLLFLNGWGRGIRTPVTGTKNRGPAAGRCPKTME